MFRGALLAVVAALLLAGCGQLGPLGAPPTETATQVPLEGTGTGQAGIGETQVNPTLAAGAHADALVTTSYTMRVEQRTLAGDGRVLRETTTYREVAAGGDSYAGRVRYNTSLGVLREYGTVDYWRNETHVATRFDSPLRQTQAGIWRTESTGPVPQPSHRPTLRTLMVATGPTVAARFDNGSVLLTGANQYPGAPFDTPPRLTAVRNVTGAFLIRDDGVITRWQLAYDATFGRETVRVIRRGRMVDIGTTTVRRPAWLAEAVPLDNETDRINGRQPTALRTQSVPGSP